MSKQSRNKRVRKGRQTGQLVSLVKEQARIAEQERVAIENQQRQYSENTSEKLIERYDPNLGRMRVETNKERQERVLGSPMEIKDSVAKTTSITAREANEMNAVQPITVLPISVVQKRPSDQEQPRHPLWRNSSLIPSSRSSSGRTLITDKFGFHPDIVNDIYTRNSRYYTDTEKVFLTTQVNLMLSLSRKNRNNQKELVKYVCKRMGISHSDTSDKALWAQLSTNIRKWSDKFEIQPIWEGTHLPSSVSTLDDKTRKQLKEDFDLFASYSFTLKESAYLANAIHGTKRASNTISEWETDGTPRDRKESTSGTKKESVSTTKEEPMPTEAVEYAMSHESGERKDTVAKIRNNAYKDDQVSAPERAFYPTDAKYWVTSKGEPCTDCGHPHCQDNLVDMPSIMVKFIRAIKDGVLDWRQLIEGDVRAEMASKNEDEVKVLRLELLEIERQLASAKNDNQTLSKQLEVVKRTTNEKEKEIKDTFS